MKEYLKTFYPVVFFRQLLEFVSWNVHGKTGGAPHWQKQRVLTEFKNKFSLKTLVETGTYLGDMVFAKKNEFEKIYSIELAEKFFLQAQTRFSKYGNIKILQGDSAAVLPSLVPSLSSSVLFWLDGHYSGGETARAAEDTPVAHEVSLIFQTVTVPFVILIDDARLFVGKNGYPTISEMQGVVEKYRPGYQMQVATDIIRIFPK